MRRGGQRDSARAPSLYSSSRLLACCCCHAAGGESAAALPAATSSAAKASCLQCPPQYRMSSRAQTLVCILCHHIDTADPRYRRACIPLPGHPAGRRPGTRNNVATLTKQNGHSAHEKLTRIPSWSAASQAAAVCLQARLPPPAAPPAARMEMRTTPQRRCSSPSRMHPGMRASLALRVPWPHRPSPASQRQQRKR